MILFLQILGVVWPIFMLWYLFSGTIRSTYNGSRDDGRD